MRIYAILSGSAANAAKNGPGCGLFRRRGGAASCRTPPPRRHLAHRAGKTKGGYPVVTASTPLGPNFPQCLSRSSLPAAPHIPVVYDNLSRGHRAAVRWGPLVVGALEERHRLIAALREHNIAAVMHFAAFAYVGESVTDPELYYRNNVGGTLALLGAMRAAGVERIVFSSTCAVYGIPDKVPIGEDTPLAPVNPYGETSWRSSARLPGTAAP